MRWEFPPDMVTRDMEKLPGEAAERKVGSQPLQEGSVNLETGPAIHFYLDILGFIFVDDRKADHYN